MNGLVPRGRRLAVDVGSVRIGVASCDPDGMLATPVETVARSSDGRDLSRIAELVAQYEAVEVVIGMPTTLRGEHGAAAHAATQFGSRIASRISPVPVVFHDERLTTVAATQMLRASGRSSRSHRSVIDQAAAVAILQSWLDQHTHQQNAVTGPAGD